MYNDILPLTLRGDDMKHPVSAVILCALILISGPLRCHAEGEWEITTESEKAVDRGLSWLARNQGPAGNWESQDLGLVALGAMAFLSAGHAPGRSQYGDNVKRALDYIIVNAKPSGLLNISSEGRDMYNHGLATFCLTQAYGNVPDRRLGKVLDKSIQLICNVQCDDGGWDYVARQQSRGHDLSLAVMQAKALRGATDIGLDIPPQVIEKAIASVRGYYRPLAAADGKQYGTDPLGARPGAFTYSGGKVTTAMAAAGAVCLQEFGQYDDFRIPRSLDYVANDIQKMPVRTGHIPFDAYTMFYVGQGLYQVGGDRWKTNYPVLRDAIVKSQHNSTRQDIDGSWEGGHVGGTPGKLFGTSVAVFVLTIPNRYLPILQEGEFPDSK